MRTGVFIGCLLPARTVVGTDQVTVRSGLGRTRWTVHRQEVATVAWKRDGDLGISTLVFLDGDGHAILDSVVPGELAELTAALRARGWPLGTSAPKSARPPEM